MANRRPDMRTIRPRDTASMDLKSILLGGGIFDVTGEHPNEKGWEIFELGQRSFWAVPDAIPWDAPVRERPEHAESIAAMLAFLTPGEKAAVTGASLISAQVPTEEAKFYFAQQALEEAKHYDALRRIIPKITGRPMAPPSVWIRLLYSFGVVDPDDVAFMMGSINIIGEHLANQIFKKIAHASVDPQVGHLIGLIQKDESRHIAAGKRFFAEVYPQFRKRRKRILAKNLATTLILTVAGYELVNPLKNLDIHLEEIIEAMYRHYADVTGNLPAFPEQALLDTLLTLLRKNTPRVVQAIAALTDEGGHVDPRRLIHLSEAALASPRALRRMVSA
jgi:hypothetical protein